MKQKSLTRLLFLLFISFFSIWSHAAMDVITVNSSGSAQRYCNANSGSFCFTQIKRDAQNDAYREAIYICEFRHHGRPRTYTISTSVICNPAFLPPNHDGKWVRCRARASMACEVEN